MNAKGFLWAMVLGALTVGCERQAADLKDAPEPAFEEPSSSEGGPRPFIDARDESLVAEEQRESIAENTQAEADFIFKLGKLRGKLAAFIELYRSGAMDQARAFAVAPDSADYQALAAELDTRGAPGFASQLDALTAAVESGGDVEQAYADVLTGIESNMDVHDAKSLLLAVSMMLMAASEEFETSVAADGTIAKISGYQQAYGYLAAARDMLASETSNDINTAEAIAVAHEQIAGALSSFAGLNAATTDGEGAVIGAAATRVERMAKKL